jgi:peptide/nickel transport system substrate-binding protein
VTQTIPVVSSPNALAIDGGSVWTTALASRASHRGGTLRVAMLRKTFGHSMVPGYALDPSTILSLAYDGLVAYRRAGGSTFGTLVGDLATDVPEPSPDGRTYVFKLRPGIRYSDGGLVQPEDFRASLEHLMATSGGDFPPFYEKIDGARACVRTPARCDLSKGIETDRAARTITIRLTEPDPELLDKLAFTFAFLAPADQPFRAKVPPPGTGPYRIASVDFKRGLRLVRNPHFRVWSYDARPAGLVDEIEVSLGNDIDAQVAAVQSGKSDAVAVSRLFGGPLFAPRIRALAARSAGQLHTDASPELDFMWMNVRTRPFDDRDVRRALNLATDRRKIEALAGGPDLAQLTCQILPPGMPGHVPSCPYTSSPSPGGGWSAPDLTRARLLIERSGTKGTRITVWSYEEKRNIARYFASLLSRLGYRSSIRVFPDYSSYGKLAADSRTGAQIGINGWSADVATPSNFTIPFLCSSFVPADPDRNYNLGGFCDPGVDAAVEAALGTREPENPAVWRDVYERLESSAPAVPLVNRREMVLVSKRVGNYQHHPLWGPLYDQMWVR